MSLDQSLNYRLGLDMVERLETALGFAERLERTHADGATQALCQILRDACDLARATADVRRAAGGEIALAPAPTTLRDLLDTLSDRWNPRAMQIGVTVLAAYDGQPELVADIDSERLVQCIDGLVGHAVSRGGPGTVETCLTARPDGDMLSVEVSVRDSAREGDARRSPGGELGLVMAREIARLLGGEVQGGDNAGAGATWTLRLRVPAAKTDAPERTAPAAALAHVLIVDDNATNRLVAEALCEGFDCTSETACDGLEALEAIHRGRFNVVLMDIKMPNLDGLGATAAIRALPGPVGQIPILAMTANADPSDIARYLAAGMQGVVEKPIKPERLAEALEAVLFHAQPAVETVGGEALEA